MLIPLFASCCRPSGGLVPQNLAPPHVAREFRGVWIATVDHVDWPSKNVFDSRKQKAELVRILDEVTALKLNTVIFQVRPAADAFYRSDLEPWSEYLTGRQGKKPSPDFDPLQFAVAESHKRGLQIHAWFNPYRAELLSAKGPLAESHIAKTDPELVKRYGSLLWMDPGEPKVQRRSLDVIEDVVRRYDIDGVHLDDYFYPYPEGGRDFPDSTSFARYGGGLSRAQWRHQNVDSFIEKLSSDIHKIKPQMEFGISPFGIYRPGVPAGIKAGIDQYSQLYSDPVKWLQNGWCDYLSPQLYWPIDQRAQSFPVLLTWWRSQNTLGRHVWPGLYTSRVMSKKGFAPQEIVHQIQVSRRGTSDAGHVHFSMTALRQDARSIDEYLVGQCYQDAALPPASPWLGDYKPERPSVTCKASGEIRWEEGKGEKPFWYVVWQRYGTEWLHRIVPGDVAILQVPASLPGGKLMQVMVVAVSRTGIESDPGEAKAK